MPSEALRVHIDELKEKYATTPFLARLEEADQLAVIETASAYFVRDTDEVANAVWITGGVIYDATWLPGSDQATLHILAVGQVTGLEIRGRPDVVRELYGSVGGDLLIRVMSPASESTLYWGADSGEEAESLRAFFIEVSRAYGSGHR